MSEEKLTTTEKSGEESQTIEKKQRHKHSTRSAIAVSSLIIILLAFLSIGFGDGDEESNPFDQQERQERQRQRHLKRKNKHTHSHQHNNTPDDLLNFSSYSCDHLNIYTNKHENRTKQCLYAKTCNGGNGVYAPIVYCSDKYSSSALKMVLAPLLLLWMLVLFRMICSTAEDYFSPSLEMLSLQIGLPPRFAGVTLLALGNGAPDIASTVNAIRGDTKLGYLMGLGELTGSSMFISTVVTGSIAYFASSGVPCKGALIRDVVMLGLTMTVVYIEFTSGHIASTTLYHMFGLYFLYVAIVLVADMYHRRYVLPRVRAQRLLQQQRSSDLGGEEDAATIKVIHGAAMPEVRSKDDLGMTQFDMQLPASNETTQLLDNTQDGGKYSNYLGSQQPNETPSELMPTSSTSPAPGPVEHILESLSNYGVDHSDLSNDIGWGVDASNGEETLVVYHPHHGGVERLPLREMQTGTLPTSTTTRRRSVTERWIDLYENEKVELWVYLNQQVWKDIYQNEENSVLDKILLTLELPFTISRMVRQSFDRVFYLSAVVNSNFTIFVPHLSAL